MEKFVEFPGLGLEFSFTDTIFSIGQFRLTYYGFLIAFGMLLAMVYAFKKFKSVGVDNDKAIEAILGGVIGGVIGARLYFVIFSSGDYAISFASWGEFWETFSRIFKTWEGGMAIYGGIIGGLILGLLVAKWRKIKVRPLLDVVGIGFLLGQGIGRWGNFFNVEAFGSNTTMPWGMTSPSIVAYLENKQTYFNSIGISVDPNIPVHPCFLYESIWCLIGFFLLAAYLKHRKFDGEVFLMYCGYYGLGRFFIEGLRTDSLMIGTLRVSQLLAGVLVFASILAILVIRSKIKGSHDPEYLKLYVKTDEWAEIEKQIDERNKKTAKSKRTKVIEKEEEPIDNITDTDQAVADEQVEDIATETTDDVAVDEKEDEMPKE